MPGATRVYGLTFPRAFAVAATAPPRSRAVSQATFTLATPSLVSESATKVSRVSGFDQTIVTWTSNVDFIGYQFRVVGAITDPVTQGVQIEADQNPPAGGSAGTQYASTLTEAEIEAVSPAESDKVVKLFLQTQAGWST